MSNLRRNMAVQLIADGQNAFKITMEPPTVRIKLGTVLTAGMLSLVGQGGVGPYAFVETDIGDSSAESGFSVNSSGQILGTATTVGHFQFIGEGQDSSSPDQTYEGTFELDIVPLLEWIDDSPPPRVEVGIPFSYQFSISGQTGSVTYSINWPSGAPSGVNFSGGVLSGTTSGTFVLTPYTITAHDNGSGEDITYDGTLTSVAAVTLNIVNGITMPTNSSFEGVAVDVGLTTGIAPYTFRVDQTTLPAAIVGGASALATNNRFGVLNIISSSEPITGLIHVTVTDAAGATASIDVPIQTFDPNQQLSLLNIEDDSVLAQNPGITYYQYDDGTPLDIFQDSSGNTHIVVQRGGGDSGGPFGSGGPYLTGVPVGDSNGDFPAGDAFDFTPSLNNSGSGNTQQRWELLTGINASWAAIDATTGEITGTLPSSGSVLLNIACTMLDGSFAGASCFSRIAFNITSSFWYAAIAAASSHPLIFDIDDLSTLYTDTAHTTLANLGDTVKAVFNKGPDGGYATSATGMVLSYDGTLGKHYLQCPANPTPGAKAFLFAYPSAYTGAVDLSIIVAAEMYATTDYQYLLQFGLDTDNGGSHGVIVFGNEHSDGTFEILNHGSAGSVAAGSYRSGTHVWCAVAIAADPSYHIYEDGSSLLGNFVTYHNLSTQQLSLWDYYGDGALGTCKRAFSTVIVDRALTSTEITYSGANAL